ncbi:MAG: hypothetical protein WA324_11315 [Bryobacteraceae bacterium]
MDSSEPAVQLLGLSDPGAYPIGVTSVQLTWTTPTHLDIRYSGQSTVNIEVVKFQGIDITAQARSGSSPSPTTR